MIYEKYISILDGKLVVYDPLESYTSQSMELAGIEPSA